MNILILSVTAGEGHNSTARAIRDALVRRGANCTILDTFDYISPELAKIISEGYLLVTEKARAAYKIGYRMAEKRRAETEHIPTKLVSLAMADDLAAYINAEYYDAVVFTHPFAGILLDTLKRHRRIHTRTVGILTDFTFHPYWEDATHNDFVVTPDRLLLPQARRKGFSDRQILPFGIPISPRFSERTPKTEARIALGLNPDATTLLLMGGSMGYGNLGETVSKIDAMELTRPFQLIAVCGNNAEAYAEISALAASSRHKILPFGFTKEIPTLMDAADCLISKPGGLTTSEALAKGLPLLIVNPIPGQEERNAEFLLNTGCAARTSKTCPIDECLYQLLSSDARLDAMRLCSEEIGKPTAAETLVDFLIDLAATPIIDADVADGDDEDDLWMDEDGYIVRCGV